MYRCKASEKAKTTDYFGELTVVEAFDCCNRPGYVDIVPRGTGNFNLTGMSGKDCRVPKPAVAIESFHPATGPGKEATIWINP